MLRSDTRSQLLGAAGMWMVLFAAPAAALAQSSGGTSGVDEQVEAIDLGDLLDPQIESASLVSEPVSEAPAPITIITGEMIAESGARNLQELLITYVPGMTLVADQNERNVAMRGVYTSSQQKLLVLLNGHRLNSRAFSSAAPDFSIGISPSKIKQIEVVRGPGSSVYGNLALNGVINIVTKSPEEVGGLDFELGAGTFGQRSGHLTYGEQYSKDHGVLLWGSYFSSEGQQVSLDDSQVYNARPIEDAQARLMHYGDPGSFDIGFDYQFRDFSVMASLRQGKYTEPFSAGGANTGEAYHYDDYEPWQEVGPGLFSRSAHAEAAWSHELSDFASFETTLYFDTNTTQQHLVMDPSVQLHTNISWAEQSFGNQSQLTLTYDAGAFGSGNYVLGGQIDAMTLRDSNWIVGRNGEWETVRASKDAPVLPQGTETIYSGFTQLKHRFTDGVITNLGVRYDFKDRLRGDNVDALSPRMAVIFGPRSTVGLKFSYSESFVDAAYWYRYNTVPNFRGYAELEPERMRAFQLSPTLRLFDGKLRNTVNFFHANHYDIIFRNKAASPDEPLYQNAGELSVAGVEEEFAYLERDWRVRANLTYQRPILFENYPAQTPEIHNVPKLFGNVVVDVKPLWWLVDDLWLDVSARYYAQQLSPVDISYLLSSTGRGGASYQEYKEPYRVVDDYVLLNAGLRWTNVQNTGLSVRANVHNILDTTYYQGGTTSHPIMQPGRWFLVHVGYRLGF